MGRIEQIAPFIDAMSEEAFESFMAAAQHGAGDGTVYATLTEAEKAEIDAAMARLDSGEGVPCADLSARIAKKLGR